MSKWLTTLAKIGLVELEDGDVSKDANSKQTTTELPPDEELEALQEQLNDLVEKPKAPPSVEEPKIVSSADAAPVSIPKPSHTGVGDLVAREAGVIYTDAAIPESPYPIERMIKLLDGLKAMPKDMRIRAIEAMDQADDSWTIEDSILDGQRKKSALKAEESRIHNLLRQREEERNQESIAQDQYIEQVTTEIRTQIDELEAMLAEELREAASKKATIEAQIEADRVAYENARRDLTQQVTVISDVLNSLQED
ncbi:MAG: hypothetical protein VX278_15265 [Myxococcota bacterium]|nr:hypothetical protein [Myxococcota bacterium]